MHLQVALYAACALLLSISYHVSCQETSPQGLKRQPAGKPAGNEIEKCLSITHQAGPPTPATYSDFFHGVPARLSLEAAWWSTKPTGPSALTIVTASNQARLRQLKAQCMAWNGPLVAAVYVHVLLDKESPTGHGSSSGTFLHRTKTQLGSLHSRLEAHNGSCALDILLLTEAMSDQIMRWLFPVNVLRNYAAMAARTDLVMMLDVDMLPSLSLQRWLAVPENAQQLQQDCAEGKLFVLPAFEVDRRLNLTTSHAAAEDAISRDKEGLLRLIIDQTVYPFAMQIWYMAQHATSYATWFTSAKAYQVNMTWDYEPWMIADRRTYPFFDSIYRAYVYEKTVQIMSAHHRGFKFMVHPEGFLIHRNHPPTKISLFFDKKLSSFDHSLFDKLRKEGAPANKANTSMYRVLRDYFERALQQMANGTYKPVLDEGLMHCLQTLSWWRGDYAHRDGIVGPLDSATLIQRPLGKWYHNWHLPL